MGGSFNPRPSNTPLPRSTRTPAPRIQYALGPGGSVDGAARTLAQDNPNSHRSDHQDILHADMRKRVGQGNAPFAALHRQVRPVLSDVDELAVAAWLTRRS